ncbi:hypothetical protein ADL12_18265 [Streptomyces regalis]|uniref:Uncharacterized protein n=1 Tax=Streptomyces regalis TaxID=68262 RepID=A0A0X3UXN3_9ACTN|nr:hypothetical protein ADL12_18265 [Streptomyces regalis]
MRRFTEGSGGRPTPAVPAELLTLMDKLAGPPDVWDRPDGDFGPLSDLYELDIEARQEANSLYRIGSKALSRDELSTAADLLGSAAAAGHPGALFRLALVALRSGKDWIDNAWFLVAEAARHGHGDAQRLLTAPASCRPSPAGSAPLIEDTSFFEEVRLLLGVALPLIEPTPPGASPAPGQRPDTPDICHATDTDSPTAASGPALVPPTRHGPVPPPDHTPNRKRAHLTALAGGLPLSVPDM